MSRGEDRRAAPHDVGLHDRGADVDERDGLAAVARVVQLELVAEREAVDVDDRGREARVLDDGGVLEDLRLLHRDQDQVQHAVVLPDALVVEEDLVDREGNVMLRFELDRTSPTSRAGTSGIWTFLMISSRPQTAIAQLLPLSPARETALLIASTTVRGSLIAAVRDHVGGRGYPQRESACRSRPTP